MKKVNNKKYILFLGITVSLLLKNDSTFFQKLKKEIRNKWQQPVRHKDYKLKTFQQINCNKKIKINKIEKEIISNFKPIKLTLDEDIPTEVKNIRLGWGDIYKNATMNMRHIILEIPTENNPDDSIDKFLLGYKAIIEGEDIKFYNNEEKKI